MLRFLPALAVTMIAATPALAEVETTDATGSVAEVADRLEAAVTESGATIVARVDHGNAAQQAGMELGESQLLIFGNPKLGTLPMQQDIRAGLFLPMKMLVYADDGKTRIAWQEPEEMFDDLDIDDDADYIDTMEKALKGFADKAANKP